MGIIRGGFLVFFSILFVVSMIGVSSLFVLQSSLSFSNVNQGLTAIVSNNSILKQSVPSIPKGVNITQSQQELFALAQVYCINRTDQYVLSYQGYTATISCVDVNKGEQAFVNNTISSVVHGIYYKNYSCSFWNCFNTETTPLFLISNMSRSYWERMFYYSLAVALALFALIFLFVKEKRNFPLLSGILLVISSFLTLGIGQVLNIFAGSFSVLLKYFIININSTFWFELIAGIILVAAGIFIRIFQAGMFFQKLFDRGSDNKKTKNNTQKNKKGDKDSDSKTSKKKTNPSSQDDLKNS